MEADQKRQDKNLFIYKKNHEDGVTFTVKLASENDQSADQEVSAVTNDFNHSWIQILNKVSNFSSNITRIFFS